MFHVGGGARTSLTFGGYYVMVVSIMGCVVKNLSMYRETIVVMMR